MGVLDSYRVNRAIQVLLFTQDPPEPERRQALATLKELAGRAVPRLIDVLADPQAPQATSDLLVMLLDNATLPHFLVGLSGPNTLLASRLVEVLGRGTAFDPNRLLDLVQDPEVPKARLVEILSRKKKELDPKALLRLLTAIDKESRTLVLRLVDEAATESLVPELIRLSASEDWLTRLYVTRTLQRFRTEAVRDTLTRLLGDPHKTVRQAALEGLAGMKLPVDLKAICALLRDPDLTVQAKAIETIAQVNDPRAVHYLLDILQDESEYVRRAAVEVLNQVGNTSAIKDLLGALRDRDWWVRVRAADALGTIGGPKVIEAVLALVKDPDTFIRRCAIEILNSVRTQIRDDRAFSSLMDSLNDNDWWVRERAIDALGGLGDTRAVPKLLEMIERDVKAAPVAIRALASLGDPKAIRPLLAHLRSQEKPVRVETIRALATLANESHAEIIQHALTEVLRGAPEDLRDLADQSLRTVTAKFGKLVMSPDALARDKGSIALPSRSLLQDQAASRGYASLIAEAGPHESVGQPAEAFIDPARLEPGMVLADRYRVRRHIGSGAFGFVVLVEDLIVHEEIILKFLKPLVASDESVIKRFIQELRFARKITHENVIRIYDFITFGRSYAISMEHFPSRSLSAELKRSSPMQTARAYHILRAICRGMDVAHRAGVIHRDLKPENVLLNDADLVKIVDFGVAAARIHGASRLTSAGVIVGTPTYMAPEQAQGEESDPRTDIYSLGVIMYEVATGRPPYAGQDPVAVLFQHVQGNAIPPRQIRPTLSHALEATILKAMAVKPADRYQSMEELGAALDALMASEGA